MTENNKGFYAEAVKSGLQGTLPPDCVAALLYTTFPSREAAVAAGTRLVEDRVAGCVNIIPAMTSVYVWEGVTQIAAEVVLIAKVLPDQLDLAAAALLRGHPYETPALLVLPVAAGSPGYLDWLRAGRLPV